jgi:hypothetical protein
MEAGASAEDTLRRTLAHLEAVEAALRRNTGFQVHAGQFDADIKLLRSTLDMTTPSTYAIALALKEGDRFIEVFNSGESETFKVANSPRTEADTVSWVGISEQDSRRVDFMITRNLEHYGPRIRAL